MTLSIQSRLTVALTATAIALSTLTGGLLYRVIGQTMTRNFDHALEVKGQAVISLVSLEAGAVLDFEFNEAAMPEYRAGPNAEYFQIQFADGKPFVKSKSLGQSDLSFGPKMGTTVWRDVHLPNGHLGRAVQIAFVPQSDPPPQAAAAPMAAVIARDRGDMDASLDDLMRVLLATAALLAAATATTSLWIVRRSLRPLHRVADQAAAIDVSRLDTRLSNNGLPTELAPICTRLNDLLARLEAAFARERRFTADVAHELRTPIAELRSIAEVALKWPDDGQATQHALADTLVIALRMETLVNTLLSLVRARKRRERAPVHPVKIAAFLEEIVKTLRASSGKHVIDVNVPQDIRVLVEPTLLGSVLTNLLGNAIEYATGDQPIRCKATLSAGQCRLFIENETSDLSEQDVAHMFEPFWRKDASRTNDSHSGLGLSLVRDYCTLMGIEVTAALLPPATLCINLSFPVFDPIMPIAKPVQAIEPLPIEN